MKKTCIPGTTFCACPEYEQLRIAYHCAILASGFYRRREYLISSKIVPQYASRCVVIPEFVQEMNKDFWIDAVEGGKKMPIQLTERMKLDIARYSVESVGDELVEKFRHEWERMEEKYWQILNELMTDKVSWIGSLEVRITKYATRTSFYLLEKKNGQHLIIHLREDASLAQLARTIILALLWPDRGTTGLTWSKRMVVADYLMSLSPLQKLFGKMKSSVLNKSIAIEWVVRSEQYIASLRVPQTLENIDVIRQNIQVFGKKEKEILLKILSVDGEIVTQDEIADMQFGVGEFGSFWAINKIIQRIRKKLDKINVDSRKLQSVKGVGYRWG